MIIGNNQITVAFEQGAGRDHFEVRQNATGWKLVFAQPKGKYAKWLLNGKPVKPQAVGRMEQLTIASSRVTIELVK